MDLAITGSSCGDCGSANYPTFAISVKNQGSTTDHSYPYVRIYLVPDANLVWNATCQIDIPNYGYSVGTSEQYHQAIAPGETVSIDVQVFPGAQTGNYIAVFSSTWSGTCSGSCCNDFWDTGWIRS